ncbi:hypothetical protein J1N35_016699, partial [Gossypium stocksii]
MARMKNYSKRNTYYLTCRRRLILKMYRKYNHRYKDCLRYKSKKILLLENDFIFHIPFDGCFPNLKVLNIDLHLTLLNGVFLNKLFQSCPLLENLSMIATCLDNFDRPLRCCIPSLKHLGFDFNVYEFKSCGHNEFIINTPNLEFLAIKDPSLSSFRIHEIPTLSLADLSIGKFNYVHDFQVLSYCFDDGDGLPTFPNLVHLELGIDYSFGWKLLPHFLENSHLLECIELDKENEENHEEGDVVDDSYDWNQPKQVTECLMHKLEEIKVRNLWRRKADGEVVKYLLENGKALKKMNIKFDEDSI